MTDICRDGEVSMTAPTTGEREPSIITLMRQDLLRGEDMPASDLRVLAYVDALRAEIARVTAERDARDERLAEAHNSFTTMHAQYRALERIMLESAARLEIPAPFDVTDHAVWSERIDALATAQRRDDATFICGGTPTPEGQRELDDFATYLRVKGRIEKQNSKQRREGVSAAMVPLARLGAWALQHIRGDCAGDIDAFDLQDQAVKLGVIAGVKAPRPCGECCVCEEMEADVCYRDTDATKAARAALAASGEGAA